MLVVEKLFNIEKRILFFLFFISMIISVNFLIFIYPAHHELLKSTHERIIDNTIFAPIRHRLLFTWVNEWLLRLYEMFLGVKHSYYITFSALMASSYFLSFVACYKLFYMFHSKRSSIVLCLLFGFSLIVGHFFHYAAPWSIIEPALFCWGFIFAFQKKRIPFLIVLLLSILNRETGIFLSVAPMLAKHNWISLVKKPKLIFSSVFEICCVILALGTFMLIRKICGETEAEMTFSAIAGQNFTAYKIILSGILYALYFHVYLLWDFKYKELPVNLRNQIPILLVSSFFFIIFGIWVEIRMINGILPLYLCLVGFSLDKYSLDK